VELKGFERPTFPCKGEGHPRATLANTRRSATLRRPEKDWKWRDLDSNRGHHDFQFGYLVPAACRRVRKTV